MTVISITRYQKRRVNQERLVRRLAQSLGLSLDRNRRGSWELWGEVTCDGSWVRYYVSRDLAAVEKNLRLRLDADSPDR